MYLMYVSVLILVHLLIKTKRRRSKFFFSFEGSQKVIGNSRGHSSSEKRKVKVSSAQS